MSPRYDTMGAMIARTNYSSSQIVADNGEQIYKERFLDAYEKEYNGQYVVIDILTKRAYVAACPEEAIHKASTDASDGLFHLMKIEATPFKLPIKSYSIDSLS